MEKYAKTSIIASALNVLIIDNKIGVEYFCPSVHTPIRW
jgi:hypothetical protein